jgi:cytochrome P450
MTNTKIKKNKNENISFHDSEKKRFGVDIEFRDSPLKFLSKLSAADYDITEFRAVGLPYALVNDPFLVNEIFARNYDQFKKSQRANSILNFGFGNGILSNPSKESHRANRKIIMPGFQKSQLEAFAEEIDRIVSFKLDRIAAKSSVDVTDLMFQTTLSIINRLLFSVDIMERESFQSQMSTIIDKVQEGIYLKFNQLVPRPKWLPTSTNIKLKNAKKQTSKLIGELINERNTQSVPSTRFKDLLSILLEAEYSDGTKLSQEQIIDELLTLQFAGHETTANTMVWALYAISQNPSVLRKLQVEVDALHCKPIDYETQKLLPYTEQVVKETLRLFPSVWCLAARTSSEKVVVGDYTIPKGVEFLCSPYTLHRNPKYFPDPEKFDPERFSAENEVKLPKGAYMPFGGGPRLCVGNHFAILESKIILANVIKRFDFHLPKEQVVEPLPQITLMQKYGMTMSFESRKIERESSPSAMTGSV